MIKKMQGRIKDSSRSLGLLTVKILSGFILGITLSLILKQVTGMGDFSFIFVIVCMIGVFVKLSQKWKFTGVLLFNLFCVMSAMLLRMYILVAPGQ
jgi:hypothetical protein